MKKKIILFGVLSLLCACLMLCACDKPEEPIKQKYVVTFWSEGRVVMTYEVFEGDPITRFPDVDEEVGYDWEIGPYPDAVTKNTTVQVYKIPKTYTVYFDYNGATMSSPDTKLSYKYMQPIDDMPVAYRDGYLFVGFKYGDKIYNKGDIYDIADNVTMVAEWSVQFSYSEYGDHIVIDEYIGEKNVDTVYIPGKIDGKEVVEVSEGILDGVEMRSLSVPFIGRSEDDIETGRIGYYFGLDYENQGEITSLLDDVTVRDGNLIAPYAFYGCAEISFIRLPDAIASIGEHAFEGCAQLQNINLANVTAVGDSAFYGCRGNGFTNVSLNAVETIGQRAFYGCAYLKTVTISAYITEIGDYAFFNCRALRTVNINAGSPFTIGEFVFWQGDESEGEDSFVVSENVSIRVPQTAFPAFTEDEAWSQYKDNIVVMTSGGNGGNGGAVDR